MSLITDNNFFHLRLFYQGLKTDLCIVPCNSFGRFFPVPAEGIILKMGDIVKLKAKGLITEKTVFHSGLEYKRYTISDFGKETFERYKSDHSK